jgi:hypothetical protein
MKSVTAMFLVRYLSVCVGMWDVSGGRQDSIATALRLRTC